jgi:hypothetical protein
VGASPPAEADRALLASWRIYSGDQGLVKFLFELVAALRFFHAGLPDWPGFNMVVVTGDARFESRISHPFHGAYVLFI